MDCRKDVTKKAYVLEKNDQEDESRIDFHKYKCCFQFFADKHQN